MSDRRIRGYCSLCRQEIPGEPVNSAQVLVRKHRGPGGRCPGSGNTWGRRGELDQRTAEMFAAREAAGRQMAAAALAGKALGEELVRGWERRR